MNLNSHARSLFLPLLAAAALAACSDSSGPADFAGSTGFALLIPSNPIDITPNGETVVLEDLMGSAEGNLYFYDVATGDLSLKTQVGSPFLDFATGVSADLKVSALYGEPVVAGVWSEATGWTAIPNSFAEGCDPNQGGAWDISADGRVMVGADWNGCAVQAMQWTETGGAWNALQLELIGSNFPDSPNPPSNRATVVSGNGQVAAGWAQTELADRRPAYWGPDGLGTFLTSGVTDDCPGEVQSINEDGTMMAGVWCQQAFYWTAASGSVILGPGGISAIAANGNLMFGYSDGGATVWTAAAGTRSLQSIATAAGVEIPAAVQLNTVKAASADGTIVTGQAFQSKQGITYSFVLKLPVSAYGL